jgi:hypothetical protein
MRDMRSLPRGSNTGSSAMVLSIRSSRLRTAACRFSARGVSSIFRPTCTSNSSSK